MPIIVSAVLFLVSLAPKRKKEVFSMAIGNGELLHKYFPKHAHGNSKNEIRQSYRRKKFRREA